MGDSATFPREDPKDNRDELSDSSDSDTEMPVGVEEDSDDGGNNADPIDANNIIQGGRRTRGKVIDFSNEAGVDEEEDEEDEEYHAEEQQNEDDEMRD